MSKLCFEFVFCLGCYSWKHSEHMIMKHLFKMVSNNDHLEIIYQIRKKNDNVQIPKEKPKNPWEKPKNPGFSLQKPKNPGGFLGFWVFE